MSQRDEVPTLRAGLLHMPRFTGKAARVGDAKALRAAAEAALADAAVERVVGLCTLNQVDP
jgi:hypothetical protein